MSGHSILLLLLLIPQEPKKADTDMDRAKRAAIVDRIMAEPARAIPARRAIVEVQNVPPAPAPGMVAIQVQGQKRITLESKEVAPAEDGDGENAPQMPIFRALNINQMALSRDNFDRWVFGSQEEDQSRKDHLDSILSERIGSLEKDREIAPEQAKKLRLAGRGDIKRFFDRVEESRREFEVQRQDYNTGRIALGQLEPLSTDYKDGPFGGDSLFAKTLRKIEGDKMAPREPGK